MKCPSCNEDWDTKKYNACQYGAVLSKQQPSRQIDENVIPIHDGELQIIYKNNKPYGIRDKGGMLFFFIKINKYTGQEERYRQEVEQQYRLADYLLDMLKSA